MNTFFIGQRVTFNGFKGTICSSLIQVTSPNKFVYFVYLVQFDKFANGQQVEFRNEELSYASVGAIPVNEKFLVEII